jgi:thiol-disulfide isomerase/thioredoxin
MQTALNKWSIFIATAFFCSCKAKKPSQSDYLNDSFLFRWHADSLVNDSILKGTREIGYEDALGIPITKEQANAYEISGDYEFGGLYRGNMRFVRKSEEAKEKEAKKPPFNQNIFEQGSAFKFFAGRDISGQRINSALVKGKIVVLNFWFLGCMPCRAEMKELNKLVDEYSPKGIIFLGITPDPAADVNATSNLNFCYTIIPDQSAYIEKLGIRAFPTHVMIDGNGRVITSFSDSGLRASHWLKKKLDSCLATSNL